MVALKNVGNKVNLKEPQVSLRLLESRTHRNAFEFQQSIIVEIIKGNCLISVVPDFLKLKKYNVNELWDKKEKEPAESAEKEAKPLSDADEDGESKK